MLTATIRPVSCSCVTPRLEDLGAANVEAPTRGLLQFGRQMQVVVRGYGLGKPRLIGDPGRRVIPTMKEEKITHNAQPVPPHGGIEPRQFVGPRLKRFARVAFDSLALEKIIPMAQNRLRAGRTSAVTIQ